MNASVRHARTAGIARGPRSFFARARVSVEERGSAEKDGRARHAPLAFLICKTQGNVV